MVICIVSDLHGVRILMARVLDDALSLVDESLIEPGVGRVGGRRRES